MTNIYPNNEVLIIPEIPKRSYLYGIEPIGIGTPFVESLTSYVTRLAQCHCIRVGDLLKLISTTRPSKNFETYFTRSSFGICKYMNGVGSWTLEFVNSFERMTLRNDLTFLTMLSWQGIYRGKLLKDHRAWCPYCLEEWKKESKSIYEPLQWQLELVTRCSVHNSKLETTCQTCSKRNLFINRNSNLGYCNKCNHWLGKWKLDKISIDSEETTWEKWVHTNISFLVQSSSTLKFFPTQYNISSLMNQLISLIGSTKGFARQFNLNPGLVRDWKKAYCVPFFTTLLKVSYILHIPLHILFTTGLPSTVNSLESMNLKHLINGKNALDPNKLRNEMRLILLEEKVPPTLDDIASKLQCSKSSLKKHCTELLNDLKEKRKEYKRILREQRLKQICSEIVRVTEEVYSEGVYPSETRLRERISDPNYFAISAARDAWRNTLSRLKLT